MLVLVASVQFVFILILLYLAVDLKKALNRSQFEAENTQLRLVAEAKSHQDTLNRLAALESVHTTREILENQPKRLKIRRTWADEERRLEEANDTRSKKHLDLVQEIAHIQNMVVKEKP